MKATSYGIDDEEFLRWVENLRAKTFKKKKIKKEDIAFRRVMGPLAPEQVASALPCHRRKTERHARKRSLEVLFIILRADPNGS